MHEAFFPPPTNREPKGIFTLFLVFEVTIMYIVLVQRLFCFFYFMLKCKSGLNNGVNMTNGG